MVDVGILGEDEKVELLNGTLRIVTPQGFDHGDVITGLTMALVRTCPPDILVRPQCPLVAEEYSLPEPDFAVLARQAMDDGRATAVTRMRPARCYWSRSSTRAGAMP